MSSDHVVRLFIHGPEKEPPLHPLSPQEIAFLLSSAFDLIEDQAVPDSLPRYAGKESWQVWRRS